MRSSTCRATDAAEDASKSVGCPDLQELTSTYRKYMENNPVHAGTIGEQHRVAETEYHKSGGGRAR